MGRQDEAGNSHRLPSCDKPHVTGDTTKALTPQIARAAVQVRVNLGGNEWKRVNERDRKIEDIHEQSCVSSKISSVHIMFNVSEYDYSLRGSCRGTHLHCHEKRA